MPKSSSSFILSLLFIVGGVCAGVAGGYYVGCVRTSAKQEKVQEPPQVALPEKPTTLTETADTLALARANATISELTAERDDLRGKLAAARAEMQEAKATVEALSEAAQPEAPEEPRLSPAERMEKLKQEDPERYAELQRRREQFQQQIMDAQANRDDFLGNIDLSLLTPEQQEVHAAYTTALARQTELSEIMREKFESGEEFTDEERIAMFENRREIRELQEQERSALLTAVGTSMGFTADESADFVALIEEVYSATQGAGLRRPRGAGPGEGGQPPPPGPLMP